MKVNGTAVISSLKKITSFVSLVLLFNDQTTSVFAKYLLVNSHGLKSDLQGPFPVDA